MKKNMEKQAVNKNEKRELEEDLLLLQSFQQDSLKKLRKKADSFKLTKIRKQLSE